MKLPLGVRVGLLQHEAGRQIGADHARKDEDEPEEAEAVQRSDRTLCFEMVHRFEPGTDVHAKARQPRDISEDEVGLKQDFRGHMISDQVMVDSASNTAVMMTSRPTLRYRT